jgi:hypothetical protein
MVVCYKCVKFHKNPLSGVGGVALTRYMDERTDRAIPIYPPNFVCGGGGIINLCQSRKICVYGNRSFVLSTGKVQYTPLELENQQN